MTSHSKLSWGQQVILMLGLALASMLTTSYRDLTGANHGYQLILVQRLLDHTYIPLTRWRTRRCTMPPRSGTSWQGWRSM